MSAQWMLKHKLLHRDWFLMVPHTRHGSLLLAGDVWCTAVDGRRLSSGTLRRIVWPPQETKVKRETPINVHYIRVGCLLHVIITANLCQPHVYSSLFIFTANNSFTTSRLVIIIEVFIAFTHSAHSTQDDVDDDAQWRISHAAQPLITYS